MVTFAFTVLASTMLATITAALPMSNQQTYALRTVHQFPNHTWIENMAVRSNGQILGTNLDGGNVFLIDPRKPQNATPPAIAYFGNDTALTGIAEVEDDIFYVQGIRNSVVAKFQFPANASSVWKIDMRKYASTGRADVQKVADIPQIAVPNGMALLSRSAGTVLIADSGSGNIWRFNVRNGRYEVAIDDAILKPIKGMQPEFGANGVKVIGSTLYFSNTNQGVVGTFPISSDGCATGLSHIITSSVPHADDFAVGPDGSVWLAENASNTVVRIFPDGNVQTVLSGQGAPAGPVSTRFGRTSEDRSVLYISTDGLTYGAGRVPLTTNGAVLAIDTY